MRCAFNDRAKALHVTANAIREITRPAERSEDGVERLRLFVEQAPVSIGMFGSDMRYIAASSRWKLDRGLSEIDLTGRLHCEFFPNSARRWREVHRRVFSGESMREELDVTTRPDGSLQWMSWEMWPWYTPAGDAGGVMMLTGYLGTGDCNGGMWPLLPASNTSDGKQNDPCPCKDGAAASNDFIPRLNGMLENIALIEVDLTEALDRAKASSSPGNTGPGWSAIEVHTWRRAAHVLAAKATAVARDAMRLCTLLDKQDRQPGRRRLN